jgi:hypothetical protein
MPILITVTTLLGPDVPPVVWKLWRDGWVVFDGPIQLRFLHPDVTTGRQAEDRLRGAALDPRLFLIEDHPDDEWSEDSGAGQASARATAAAGEVALRAAGSAWTPEEDALLFRATAAEIARLTGRTLKAVERRRALVRRRGGHAAARVGAENEPAVEGEGRGRTASMAVLGRPQWAAWQVALIGTLPDDEVAARSGRSLSAVKQKRVSLGISVERVRQKCRERVPNTCG